MNDALLEVFIKYILPVLGTGLATLVAWVLKKIGDKVATESALGQVAHYTGVAVLNVEQTLRKKFIAAAADGKITAEEKVELREAALEQLKYMLIGGKTNNATVSADEITEADRKIAKMLKASPIAVDEILESHIEAAVAELHKAGDGNPA